MRKNNEVTLSDILPAKAEIASNLDNSEVNKRLEHENHIKASKECDIKGQAELNSTKSTLIPSNNSTGTMNEKSKPQEIHPAISKVHGKIKMIHEKCCFFDLASGVLHL